MTLLESLLLLLCFQVSEPETGILASDEPTPVELRSASWKQHVDMRQTSEFSLLKWEQIGPVFPGGRIECITPDPAKPTTLYVGVGSGGLWKSTNNATTWTPIFEQQPSIAVGDVAVAPSATDTVWLGTGEVLLARSSLPGMGVFRSKDAGETWENMGLEDTQHIARVLIHPTNPSTVYVAAIGHQNSSNEQRGVFRTRNAGQSWEKVLYINDHTSAIDLAMHPDQPDVLFASMWQRAPSGAGGKHSGQESGVYKTTDGGDSWTRLGGGLPSNEDVGRIAVAIAASSPQTVYALADEGPEDGFYRSTDGGVTWTKTYDKLKAGWDWCELRVSPDDAEEVYSIGQNSFVTRDGGRSFKKIGGDIVHLLPHGANVIHLDTHAMWINPSNADHIIFGTDGGIFVSHDRCKTWLHYNNMPIAECYAITYDMQQPFNVYVGTQDNAALFGPVAHRPQTGLPDAWKHVYLDPWGGGDSYFTYRDPDDRDTIFYEHQYGDLRRKNMLSGVTEPIKPKILGDTLRFAWMTPFFPSRHAPKTWYYAANRVFKSTNRGSSWSVISDDLVSSDRVPNLRYRAITTLAESPLQQGLLFAGTDNADLWMTEDDGANWQPIADELPTRSISRVTPSPHDSNRLYCALNGSGLDDFAAYAFRSNDQGKTWDSIGHTLPHESVHVIVEDPRVAGLLYLGTDLGIYTSLDDGDTWQSLCSNLPTASVQDIFVHPRDNLLVIATHGRSCFVADPSSIQAAAKAIHPRTHSVK
ncbi:MAG: hypothetical protein Aurels2KO_27900 [Aureliella sp.]